MGNGQAAQALEAKPAHQQRRLDDTLECRVRLSRSGHVECFLAVGAQDAIALVRQRQRGQRRTRAEHIRSAGFEALLGLELLRQPIGDPHGQVLARRLGDQCRVDNGIAWVGGEMPDLDELVMIVIDDIIFRRWRIVGGNSGKRDERPAARVVECLAGVDALAATCPDNDVSLGIAECGFQALDARVRHLAAELEEANVDTGVFA